MDTQERMYRWRCRNCDYSLWTTSRDETVNQAKSHLITHYRSNIRSENFGVVWSCPYCDATARGHDEEETLEQFKDHLFDHVEPLLESGVHVADDVDGIGDILVAAPVESTGADNARIHFISPADICIFVTTNPKRRIELIEEELDEWPAWTVVITSKTDPLAGITGVDLSEVPLELVQLDKSLGLASLGETISRVLEEYESSEGKVSMEFDILPEIIEKFELQSVFKFLHVFSSRCEDAGAISHYYVDPDRQEMSTVNVLDQLFNVKIYATETGFQTQE